MTHEGRDSVAPLNVLRCRLSSSTALTLKGNIMTYAIHYTINLPGHHTHGEKRVFAGGNGNGMTFEAANGLAAIFAEQDDMANILVMLIL